MAYDDNENLDAFLAAKAAGGQDEDTAAPISAYASPISKEMRDALVMKVYREAMGNDPDPETASIEARIREGVSGGQMPGNNPLSGLGQALAQSSQAQADVMLKNPYTSMSNKLAAAGRAGTAGMVGTVFDNLVNKRRADAQDQLNADVKRASALRALHPKGGAATSLAVLNNEQREQQMQHKFAADQAKADAAARAADPNSEDSKSYREAMVRSGAFTPEQLEGLSKTEMAAIRTAGMQTARLDAQGLETDRKAANEERAKELQAQSTEERQIKEEQRKEQRRAEQSQIDGVVWKGNKVPDDNAVEQVRKAAMAHSTLVQGNRRLAEIQQELADEARIAGVPIGDIERYIGTDKAKHLMAEADLINNGKLNAIRDLENFGVPQQFELELINRYNRAAGSIGALFNGPANWEEGAKYSDKQLRQKMKLRNAYFADDPDAYSDASPGFAQQDAASMVTRKPVGEYQKYQPRGAQPKEALPEVPAVSEKLPTAPVPAQSLPAGKMYLVKTASGWTKTPVSKEQADRALQAGFASEVKEAK